MHLGEAFDVPFLFQQLFPAHVVPHQVRKLQAGVEPKGRHDFGRGDKQCCKYRSNPGLGNFEARIPWS